MKFNPKFRINLETLIAKTTRGKSKEVKRKARETALSEEFSNLFGQRILSKIRSNTRVENKDKKGRPLKGYSESYKNSDEFKVLKISSSVNMTLTGEMLDAMKATKKGANIEFSFTGKDAAAKAHGHINGGNYLPVRDFFGLPETQIKDAFNSTMQNLIDLERVAETDFTLNVSDLIRTRTTQDITDNQSFLDGDDLFGTEVDFL